MMSSERVILEYWFARYMLHLLSPIEHRFEQITEEISKDNGLLCKTVQRGLSIKNNLMTPHLFMASVGY